MWNTNFCFCLKTKMQTHAQTQTYLNRGGEREMQGKKFFLWEICLFYVQSEKKIVHD